MEDGGNKEYIKTGAVALCFDYNILNSFRTGRMLRKQQLHSGKITKGEYLEWKLNWPQTADDWGGSDEEGMMQKQIGT